MKIHTLLILFIVQVTSAYAGGDQIKPQLISDPELMKKVGEIWQQTQHLKEEMTRADIDKLFTPAAGWRPSQPKTYEYRSCGYIKIDVTFVSTGKKENPEDTIISISKPYLDMIAYD